MSLIDFTSDVAHRVETLSAYAPGTVEAIVSDMKAKREQLQGCDSFADRNEAANDVMVLGLFVRQTLDRYNSACLTILEEINLWNGLSAGTAPNGSGLEEDNEHMEDFDMWNAVQGGGFDNGGSNTVPSTGDGQDNEDGGSEIFCDNRSQILDSATVTDNDEHGSGISTPTSEDIINIMYPEDSDAVYVLPISFGDTIAATMDPEVLEERNAFLQHALTNLRDKYDDLQVELPRHMNKLINKHLSHFSNAIPEHGHRKAIQKTANRIYAKIDVQFRDILTSVVQSQTVATMEEAYDAGVEILGSDTRDFWKRSGTADDLQELLDLKTKEAGCQQM
jgi:hypothetical protein